MSFGGPPRFNPGFGRLRAERILFMKALGYASQGDSHDRRHDQTTRTGSGIWLHSRRQRPGVVLSSQFGSGSFDELNEGQRVSFEEEPLSQGPARRQRAQRRGLNGARLRRE